MGLIDENKFESLTGFELGPARLLSMNVIHYTTKAASSVGKKDYFCISNFTNFFVFMGGIEKDFPQ